MKNELSIRVSSPDDPDVSNLVDELSDVLAEKTGRDGRIFWGGDFFLKRSVFLAGFVDEKPIACGALRPFNEEICEIKRMYSRQRGSGIGGEILESLEKRAQRLGYKTAFVETDRVNEGAVRFYLKNGYKRRENYGKYVGKSSCVCFEKDLRA